MATTYIPPDSSGYQFLDSMQRFSSFMLELQQQQQRQQLLQQELAEGKLRQAALRIQNEQQQTQLGEFKDTKNLRMQALQARTSGEVTQAEREKVMLGEAGTKAELAQKQLGRFDIEAHSSDELHKIMMDVQRSQLLNQGINRQEAEKRLSMLEPQFNAQIDEMKASTQRARAQTKQAESATLLQASDDEWGKFEHAMTLLKDKSPGAKQSIIENISQVAPQFAPYVKAFATADLSDPKKAAEQAVDSIIAGASQGQPDMLEAGSLLAALRETGGRGLPVMRSLGTIQDPKTGKAVSMGNVATFDASELANKLAKAWQTGGRNIANQQPVDTTPRIQNAMPNAFTPPATMGGQTAPRQAAGGDMSGLPLQLREKWKYLQANPDLASRSGFSNRDDPDLQSFLSKVPREREEQSADALLAERYPGQSTPFDWPTATSTNRRRMPTQRSFFDTARSEPAAMTEPGQTFDQPVSGAKVLNDLDDQVFRQNYDPDKENSSIQQRVMYDGLMRELAKAKNTGNNKAAKTTIKNFFDFQPALLTNRQYDSIRKLVFQFGWGD